MSDVPAPGVPDLLARIDRDLRDADAPALSLDRRFATACAAAKGLAALALYARSCPRVPHDGPFAAPRGAAEATVASRARYLERCQSRCWRIENLDAGRTTVVEVEELLFELAAWRAEVARALDDSGPAPVGAGPYPSYGARSRGA